MTNVVYGTATASEGDTVETPAAAPRPSSRSSASSPQAVTLAGRDAVTIGGYEYTFLGQREFAGIPVRRNRSDTSCGSAVACW